MAEIKDFLDPATLEWPTADAEGNINWREPDIAMALPFVGESGDTPNGAVWPWRLSLGAEDDPNRDKVYKWEQVDDLGGLAPLWAGVYNGTIFLHAGEQAPTAATDDSSDATGTPVASADDVWHNGEPLPPFAPVPMDVRESMLRNSNGAWRRLVWEPAALFDVCTSKSFSSVDAEGNVTYNLRRYTLYMVAEYPFVSFFTTAAMLNAKELDNDAEPRWPYGHYAPILTGVQHGVSGLTYGIKGADGGFPVGFGNDSYWRFFWGYRLAPLPWQNGDGTLETETEFHPNDGVQEGQFYNLPQQYPCGRYLATFANPHVDEALSLAYVAAANKKNKEENGKESETVYAYEYLTEDQAKEAIVDTIKIKATESYSVDPALMEEKGNGFPTGEFDRDIYMVEDPPPYFTVFSLHLPKEEDRWPHWLAMLACHTQTALLTASACSWYNDFRPAGGWPEDETGNLPEADATDPDDTAPGEEDDDDQNAENGGVIPDDSDGTEEDDPATDEDNPDGGEPPAPVTGFFYRAGDRVKVSSSWQPSIQGWTFSIQVETISIKGDVDYIASLTTQTANDGTQYDSVHGENLTMSYGLEANPEFVVKWRSSLYGDAGPKEATASKANEANVGMSLVFEPVYKTSSNPPNNFCGNILIAKPDGFIVKRFKVKKWDSLTGHYKLERVEKRYEVYRLNVAEILFKWMDAYYVLNAPTITNSDVRAISIDDKTTVEDTSLRGTSEGLEGPKVTPAGTIATPTEKATTINAYGKFQAVAYITYNIFDTYSVSGGDRWDAFGPMTGSINGDFEVTFFDEVTKTVKF